MDITTIQLDKQTKGRLDALKVHARESYNELILRLIENCPANASRESLIETIEVLSDPEAMRNIAKSLQEIERGESGVSLEELEKELGL
ncbi:hypothetical protein KAT24_01285 [Candidatus Pacearchaeota archaeon]|nr:hypothetical protein [Candidatus Pacearchaeota archaeon]